jgi:hypothetical protein
MNDDHNDLDSVTVPKGTLVHVGGYPFFLASDTVLKGRQVNFDLAKRALDLQIKLTGNDGSTGPTAPGVVQPADIIRAREG